jgi:hypothetical protein
MSSQQQVQVPQRYARVNAWVISRDTDAKPGWPPTPAHLRVYVGDVAAAVDQAVAAGARVVTKPTLLAFGERVARVRDPQGHLWWLHEHVEDVSPEELARRIADPAAHEAMAYVQGTLREEIGLNC